MTAPQKLGTFLNILCQILKITHTCFVFFYLRRMQHILGSIRFLSLFLLFPFQNILPQWCSYSIVYQHFTGEGWGEFAEIIEDDKKCF